MYLKSLNLKKKIALVTGAGKGIGRASAIALAEAGADLIILSRTEKDLIKVKKEINKLKRKCEFYVCDLFDFDQITEVFSKINRLDILVNNAGTNIPEFFNKIKKEDMDYMVDLNLKAFHVAQLASERCQSLKIEKQMVEVLLICPPS